MVERNDCVSLCLSTHFRPACAGTLADSEEIFGEPHSFAFPMGSYAGYKMDDNLRDNQLGIWEWSGASGLNMHQADTCCAVYSEQFCNIASQNLCHVVQGAQPPRCRLDSGSNGRW